MNPQERAELSQFLLRLADGDRAAFDPIYEMTWPLVNCFASKMISSPIEAEDVAQIALMKVFSRATEFRRDGDALSWILGITAFECKTSRQKVRRRKEHFHADQVVSTQADSSLSAEERLIDRDLELAVEEVLNGLSVQDQETIRIAIHQIERPDMRAATFRKRLERAFGRLRDSWRDQYE